MALLSKHSRECFECQCNNSIYRHLDLKLDKVVFIVAKVLMIGAEF